MIKIDRITALSISGIFMIISICMMNTAFLLLSLLAFTILAFYNMGKNVQENKLFSHDSLSKGKKLFCEAIFGIAVFGIIMAFIGLFLLL